MHGRVPYPLERGLKAQMAGLLAPIPGAEAFQSVLLRRKNITASGKVCHGMGDKVNIEQAWTLLAKKIGRDAGNGMGQNSTELGE